MYAGVPIAMPVWVVDPPSLNVDLALGLNAIFRGWSVDRWLMGR
jgi:hypothetical protein